MKTTFTRFLVYAAIILIAIAIFNPPSPPPGPFAARAGYLTGAILVPLIFFSALFETAFRIFRRSRKSQGSPDALPTQPLATSQDALPTRPIETNKPPF